MRPRRFQSHMYNRIVAGLALYMSAHRKETAQWNNSGCQNSEFVSQFCYFI